MNAIINARIYDYVTYIENGYLLYDDKVVEDGDMKNFKNKGYDKVEDFKGDLLMPTFVCAHSHIYSIFARGLALPFNPKNFQEILDQMWWKIDAQLDNKETYYSSIVAGQEFLLNGVTTVIDHHASGEITGSLSALRKAFVGPLKMRGIFCFETSDRYDVKKCFKENLTSDAEILRTLRPVSEYYQLPAAGNGYACRRVDVPENIEVNGRFT